LAILAIVNAAAEAYRGVIPADRWCRWRQVETSVVLANPPLDQP
jgi:hypothetical protein